MHNKINHGGINNNPIRIFVGYDNRYPIAYHTCVQSILEHCSLPVSITPLKIETLNSLLQRSRDKNQLTDFSYSRFLAPFLCGFEGWSIFIGGDMIIREDIANLYKLQDPDYAVMVVKHPTFTQTHTFLDNSVQPFPRFNWSSVMLFNNSKCQQLSVEYINKVDYETLHQFKWLEDNQIGELPASWNYLPGFDNQPKLPNPHLVHWTLGGPYLGEKYANLQYADEWRDVYRTAIFPYSKG